MAQQDHSVDTFPFRLSLSVLVGYLLATVPQAILDPLLSSHIKYGSRTYPLAWWIVPIATAMFVTTFLIAKRPGKLRLVLVILPFVAACLLSIPLFGPELPHGNLVFVSAVWFLLALITVWIHNESIIDDLFSESVATSQARIEYIKEQMSIWKTIAIGLIVAFLGMVVTLTKELHANNATIVTTVQDLFLLNQYTNFSTTLMSLFMFTGPIYEAVKKIRPASTYLLTIR